ncbi:MAG TPA: hypothetical protein VJB56_01000 [Candidatus Paceibacterota bacterium]
MLKTVLMALIVLVIGYFGIGWLYLLGCKETAFWLAGLFIGIAVGIALSIKFLAPRTHQ